jgi:hypothetical protein
LAIFLTIIDEERFFWFYFKLFQYIIKDLARAVSDIIKFTESYITRKNLIIENIVSSFLVRFFTLDLIIIGENDTQISFALQLLDEVNNTLVHERIFVYWSMKNPGMPGMKRKTNIVGKCFPKVCLLYFSSSKAAHRLR